MRRFVEEADRGQWTLLPECLDDFIDESNPVRVIDVFVDALDLAEMSFEGVEPAATGRPSYHPSVLLKLYIYGYLNRVQSSRRLEREAGRNVEVMWLLGRLAPDHKTIADFRKDNGLALRKVCARFVELCREMGLLATASVAIDGSKFKAVNNRDKNFTRAKVERRRAQLEESVARYLSQLDTADRQEPTEALAAKVTRLTEKLTKLKEETHLRHRALNQCLRRIGAISDSPPGGVPASGVKKAVSVQNAPRPRQQLADDFLFGWNRKRRGSDLIKRTHSKHTETRPSAFPKLAHATIMRYVARHKYHAVAERRQGLLARSIGQMLLSRTTVHGSEACQV
jgi:transposase